MDEYATGWRTPFSSHWDSIAPVAKLDASHSTMNSFVGLGCTNTGAVINLFLSSSNAFCSFSVHAHFPMFSFFVRFVRGFAMSEKWVMNRL